MSVLQGGKVAADLAHDVRSRSRAARRAAGAILPLASLNSSLNRSSTVLCSLSLALHYRTAPASQRKHCADAVACRTPGRASATDMQWSMGSIGSRTADFKPCRALSAPFRPAHDRSGSRHACRRAPGRQICSSAAEQHNSTAQRDAQISGRRAVLHAAASIVAITAASPSSALVEGFTPMSSLKGKDYGKSRMR